MRLKSAHRTPATPAANSEEPPQPSESVKIDFDTNQAEPVDIVAIDTAIPEPDEATAALQKQLDHLRASEQAQREFAQQVAAQRAAQMTAPAPTLPAEPEARIALWRQQGLSDEDASFLEARPDMVNNPALTRLAYGLTLQAGIERNSPDFAAAMEGNFATLLNRAQAQANPAAQPTPAFFQPPEPARSPSPSPASIYSAPVSRQAPSTGYREPSPRSVKLTVEEQQIAAASGISDVQYAQNKLKMLRERASGQRE